MDNHWTIQLPQRFVSNLLGETSDPFVLYGNTIEDQNARIDQMEKAGENDAVQLMHFLILFNSVLFHNPELSKSCLEKIKKENVSSIWKPWITFFQCFTDIVSLPTIEKKVKKRELEEIINRQRDQLLGKILIVMVGKYLTDNLPKPQPNSSFFLIYNKIGMIKVP